MKTTATTKQRKLQQYGQQHQRQLKIQQYIDNNIIDNGNYNDIDNNNIKDNDSNINMTTTSKTVTVTSI